MVLNTARAFGIATVRLLFSRVFKSRVRLEDSRGRENKLCPAAGARRDQAGGQTPAIRRTLVRFGKWTPGLHIPRQVVSCRSNVKPWSAIDTSSNRRRGSGSGQRGRARGCAFPALSARSGPHPAPRGHWIAISWECL